jgi:hypothetical protein
MSLGTAIAADWQYIDGIEDVTYTTPAGVATASVKARRMDLRYSEVLNGPLGLESTDTAWEVWAAGLGATVPIQGGTITDSTGVVWTVLAFFRGIGLGPVVATWRCACRKQR